MKQFYKYSASALCLMLAAGCSQEDKSSAVVYQDLNGNGKMDVYENPSLSLDERAADIVSHMTLEQKAGMVRGLGWSIDGSGMEGIDKVPGAAGYTLPLPELGIPSLTLADGPAGLRIKPQREGDTATYYATAFPVATLLASSWNTDLVETIGEAMGSEVKEYGVDIFLAPGMNIHRNPLGGRNFEYYSEDPLVSGLTAAAMVNGIESKGVGATIKHYVANNQETNRFLVDTIVSERAMREIYLKGFKIAVEKSHPWAIMSSYNKLDGVYVSQDKDLLTTILRDEWDYDGFVMTDWFAGDNPAEQLKAGNDLIMPGTDKTTSDIKAALDAGTLTEADLDVNATRILAAALKSPTITGYKYSNKPDLKGHAAIALQAASEGVVLLKNENAALPLAKATKTVAAFGNTSYELISGGTGSGDVNEAYTVSLVQGLAGKDLSVSADLAKVYEAFIADAKTKRPKKQWFMMEEPLPEMKPTDAMIAEQAASNDVALITIGRNSGEFVDRNEEGDFYLHDVEKDLIKRVSEAFHAQGKKVVVILNIANVVETASWRDYPDAIVLPWQGGQEAGNAIANVLTGVVNPSGKLATTFSMTYDDVPSADSFPGVVTSDEVIEGLGGLAKGNPSEVEYRDGIFVGYRYYDTYGIKPAYEFGYGLSYTTFGYGAMTVSSATFADKITVSLDITNTGAVAGKEVVQLYLAAPQGKLYKPVKELKAYGKTRELKPGESQTLSFTLDADALSSFDSDRTAWVAEAGTYKVLVGASSRDIKETGSFTLASEIVGQKLHPVLKPSRDFEEKTGM